MLIRARLGRHALQYAHLWPNAYQLSTRTTTCLSSLSSDNSYYMPSCSSCKTQGTWFTSFLSLFSSHLTLQYNNHSPRGGGSDGVATCDTFLGKVELFQELVIAKCTFNAALEDLSDPQKARYLTALSHSLQSLTNLQASKR